MNTKIYIGKGRKAEKLNIVNFSICLTDIPKDEIFEYNGKEYLKLAIGEMKQADKYGKTHTVWVDDFKPEKKEEPEVQKQDDDLPF
jgi:hypothetical protein